MRKVVLLLVAVAAVVIGAYAVAVSAQESPEEGAAESPYRTSLTDVLDQLVEDGTLDREQADAVREALEDRELHRHGLGHKGFHGGAYLETAADVLGTTVEDLVAQLRESQSLADIAGAQTDELITALVADAEERIRAAADAGRITQEQADDKMAGLTDHITAMVNGEWPAGFHGRPFGRDHGFGHDHPFGPDHGSGRDHGSGHDHPFGPGHGFGPDGGTATHAVTA